MVFRHLIFFLFFSTLLFGQNIVVIFKKNKCFAKIKNKKYFCLLGKNGVSSKKIEGDQKTPKGNFPLRKIWVRYDQIDSSFFSDLFSLIPVQEQLPIQGLKPWMGWCDEPSHSYYNQLIDLRNFDTTVSHEKMFRDDEVYNIVLEVGYNDDPIISGKGSAIFIHLTTPNLTKTAGCVSFQKEDLLDILTKVNRRSKLIVR